MDGRLDGNQCGLLVCLFSRSLRVIARIEMQAMILDDSGFRSFKQFRINKANTNKKPNRRYDRKKWQKTHPRWKGTNFSGFSSNVNCAYSEQGIIIGISYLNINDFLKSIRDVNFSDKAISGNRHVFCRNVRRSTKSLLSVTLDGAVTCTVSVFAWE